jgi:hypothetical protein
MRIDLDDISLDKTPPKSEVTALTSRMLGQTLRMVTIPQLLALALHEAPETNRAGLPATGSPFPEVLSPDEDDEP